MTTSLMTLTFEGKGVRFVGTPDRPEWIASDVCAVLGIENARDAMASVPEDEKGVAIADTLGGQQEMTTLLEPGLYRLTFRSRKAEAERFKKWVFAEVLPMIRRSGAYVSPAALESRLAETESRLDAILALVAQERRARLSSSGYEMRRHQIDGDARKALERRADPRLTDGEQSSLPFSPPPRRRSVPLPTLTDAQRGAIFTALSKCFHGPFSAREVLDLVTAQKGDEADFLRAALAPVGARSAVRLGAFLSLENGKSASSLMLGCVDGDRRGYRYRVLATESGEQMKAGRPVNRINGSVDGSTVHDLDAGE